MDKKGAKTGRKVRKGVGIHEILSGRTLAPEGVQHSAPAERYAVRTATFSKSIPSALLQTSSHTALPAVSPMQPHISS